MCCRLEYMLPWKRNSKYFANDIDHVSEDMGTGAVTYKKETFF